MPGSGFVSKAKPARLPSGFVVALGGGGGVADSTPTEIFDGGSGKIAYSLGGPVKSPCGSLGRLPARMLEEEIFGMVPARRPDDPRSTLALPATENVLSVGEVTTGVCDCD